MEQRHSVLLLVYQTVFFVLRLALFIHCLGHQPFLCSLRCQNIGFHREDKETFPNVLKRANTEFLAWDEMGRLNASSQ